MVKRLIILISFFAFALFSDVLVNSVSADHCGNLTYCEQCVLSHCGWGGPNGDIKCRDAGSHAYSCPASNYSLWYTLPGECGISDKNKCSANVNTPPPCNTFNGNCSSCLQQPACAYSGGYQCVSVDPAVGNVCPAGVTSWNWSSCTQNECSVASAPSPSPVTPAPSPLPSASPGSQGYRTNIQTCKTDGSGWEVLSGDANVCTIACGVPAPSGQPAPAPVTQPVTIPPAAPVAPTTPGLTTPWIQTSGGDVHSNTKIDVP